MLGLFDIDVIVSSSGVSSINTVNIRLGGADTSETDGIVYRAEIADINADGLPEIYAYVIEEDMTMSPVTLSLSGRTVGEAH